MRYSNGAIGVCFNQVDPPLIDFQILPEGSGLISFELLNFKPVTAIMILAVINSISVTNGSGCGIVFQSEGITSKNPFGPVVETKNPWSLSKSTN